MSQHRMITALIQGLIALSMLVLLVVGTPVALWSLVGWPLPSAIPEPHAVLDTLTHGQIPDSTLVKAVGLVGWIAWLQVALTTVVEVVACARGLTPRHVGVGRALQQPIRHLVATTALLLSSTGSPVAALDANASPAPVIMDHEPPNPLTPRNSTGSAPAADVTAPADPAASSAPHEPTYIVQRRDTLWGIAERHLGDPFRWRELFDLNKERPQADGRRLTDPNLIDIGWSLTLPSDAVGLTGPPNPPGPASAPTLQEDLGVDDESVTPEPTPETASPTTTVPAPPTTDPAPPPTTPAADPTNQEAPTGTIDPETSPTPDGSEEDAQDDHDADLGRFLAPLLGGGLLAASLLAILNRFRSIRVRNHRPRLPADDATEALEVALRRVADVEGANRLDLALRAFAAGIAAHRQRPLPTVSAVRLNGAQVDLLLDTPLEAAPPGFTSTGNPRGWKLDPDLSDSELKALAQGCVAPLPSLVTVGTVDGDPVLIDVETAGILTITGDPTEVQPVLRRLVAELATSAWTDWLDVITVGSPIADVAGSHRALHHLDLRSAVDNLAKVARYREQELAEAGHPSTWAARLADVDGEGWFPTVLVVTDALSEEHLEEVRAIVRAGGQGVAAILIGTDTSTGWSLEVRGSDVVLQPHGLTLTAVGLSDQTAEDLDQLLTDEMIDDVNDTAQAEVAATRDDPAVTDPGPFADPAFEIEIRLLGSVEISGGIDIKRPKNLEIAAYLALHPEGVSDDKLKTVFWPSGKPSRATFNTTMSMTRSALGLDAQGNPRLPHFSATRQRYQLTDAVTTDLARFEARWTHARQSPPDRAVETLREALALVRGQPFDVGKGFEWAFAEGIATRAAISIADAAHHLAQLAIEQGDLELANWAALRGLLAAPGDEALYRDRMLAAYRAGNVSAVKRIMSELCDAVEVNEPYDQLHPDTVRLYKHIVGTDRGDGSTHRPGAG